MLVQTEQDPNGTLIRIVINEEPKYCRLGSTCKLLAALTQVNSIWKPLVLRDFKFVAINVVGIREGWEDFVELFGGLAIGDEDGNDEEYFVTWLEAFRAEIFEHLNRFY